MTPCTTTRRVYTCSGFFSPTLLHSFFYQSLTHSYAFNHSSSLTYLITHSFSLIHSITHSLFLPHSLISHFPVILVISPSLHVSHLSLLSLSLFPSLSSFSFLFFLFFVSTPMSQSSLTLHPSLPSAYVLIRLYLSPCVCVQYLTSRNTQRDPPRERRIRSRSD